jgi:hypothetical protein
MESQAGPGHDADAMERAAAALRARAQRLEAQSRSLRDQAGGHTR